MTRGSSVVLLCCLKMECVMRCDITVGVAVSFTGADTCKWISAQ